MRPTKNDLRLAYANYLRFRAIGRVPDDVLALRIDRRTEFVQLAAVNLINTPHLLAFDKFVEIMGLLLDGFDLPKFPTVPVVVRADGGDGEDEAPPAATPPLTVVH